MRGADARSFESFGCSEDILDTVDSGTGTNTVPVWRRGASTTTGLNEEAPPPPSRIVAPCFSSFSSTTSWHTYNTSNAAALARPQARHELCVSRVFVDRGCCYANDVYIPLHIFGTGSKVPVHVGDTLSVHVVAHKTKTNNWKAVRLLSHHSQGDRLAAARFLHAPTDGSAPVITTEYATSCAVASPGPEAPHEPGPDHALAPRLQPPGQLQTSMAR